MNLIKTPILTEKAALGMGKGLYVILVDPSATKPAIVSEIKHQFDLDVISIRVVNSPAKKVKFKRIPGFQPSRRKAYIQLKEGQKLPGFELPKQEKAKNQES